MDIKISNTATVAIEVGDASQQIPVPGSSDYPLDSPNEYNNYLYARICYPLSLTLEIGDSPTGPFTAIIPTLTDYAGVPCTTGWGWACFGLNVGGETELCLRFSEYGYWNGREMTFMLYGGF